MEQAYWVIPGVVVEKRDLRTKAGQVFKYIASVAGVGQTYEVEFPLDGPASETYAKVGVGQSVCWRGTFKHYAGKAQFVFGRVESAASGKGSAA